MRLHSSYTDAQLLVSLKEGDAGAFTEIYERYWDRLLVTAMRGVKRQSDAEDLVQELFVSLWRRRHELAVELKLSTYLFNSIRYLALRHIERNMHQADHLQQLVARLGEEQAPADIEASILLRELEGEIDKAVQLLPEKMREVFVLSRFHHLSYKEIADRLSISEETVKKQIYKALQILRKFLGPLPAGLILGITTYCI